MEDTHNTVDSIFSDIALRFSNYILSWGASDTGSYWVVVPCNVFILTIFVPIVVVMSLVFFLLMGIRLAIDNADRVIFVLASSLLAYYSVPHTAFYVYIAVVVFTGFLQILRWESPIRYGILTLVGGLTLGLSNAFLRRCTSLHYHNPFTRRLTNSRVIYVPVGSPLPPFVIICYFQFKIPDDFDAVGDHELTVGDCQIKIQTVPHDNIEGTVEQGIEGENRIRSLQIEAPWGVDRITFEMNDDNLRRLLGYLISLMESENKAEHCTKLICSGAQNLSGSAGTIFAMTLSETIEHFNDGGKLVRLEYV